jgi:hypothetical protein
MHRDRHEFPDPIENYLPERALGNVCRILEPLVTRVNSTNVQYEGLRIGGIGHRMNSKVKSVKQGAYRK